MRATCLLTAALFASAPSWAAESTGTTGDTSVTVVMDMLLGDSITLTVTGDPTGNTTLGVADTTLSFGNVYYGAVGPLGTAGIAYPNPIEENEYVISRLSIDVEVSGLLTGADITASEGAGATYSDPANITPIITDVGAILTPWAVNGTTGVNDLSTSPALGTVLSLVPLSLEAGFRIARAAAPGATSVPFVITATAI